VIIPMFEAMKPAPRVAVTRFMAGVHTYTKPERGLRRHRAGGGAVLHGCDSRGYFVA